MAKKYPQLSIILKKLLFDKNMKPVDLAREVELPQPTIHRLVTGKSMRPYKSSLKPIADYFSISVEQLVGEDSFPSEYLSNHNPSNNKIKTIPIIAWTEVQSKHEIKIKNKQSIVSAGNISDDCFALLMPDHSMEPLFPKRSILIFDPHKTAIDRSFVLVKLHGVDVPIFRQLLVDIDQKYLKPLNPDLNIYQMRLLDTADRVIASLFESRIQYGNLIEDSLLEEVL